MDLRQKRWYREKKYVCGEFLDVYIYPVVAVRRDHRKGKRIKKRPSREVQQKLNRRHAQEKMTRLIHNNFTEDDLAATFTWAENPENEQQAKKDVQRYLDKLRYRYKKMGLELKYIWQLEKSKNGRYHVHFILSGGMDRDALEKLWGHGYANTKRLQFDSSGAAALARYMTKTHQDDEDEENERTTYRSYNASRNLIDPAPEINDSRIRSRKKAQELADEDWNAWHELYPAYELSDLRPFCSDEYGSVYIFARLRRAPSSGPSGHLPPREGKGNGL